MEQEMEYGIRYGKLPLGEKEYILYKDTALTMTFVRIPSIISHRLKRHWKRKII